MESGVYKIINIINNKFYIGSSFELTKRKRQHFSDLKFNRHTNTYLQNSFNKYGEENFKFEVLALCPQEYLIKLEQWFLDTQKPNYNIMKNAYSILGYEHTEETKNKMKKAIQNRKNKCIANGAFKLTKENVADIRRMLKLGYFYREIQEKYPISEHNLWCIKNRKTWKEIPDYILKSDDVINKRKLNRNKPIYSQEFIDSLILEIKETNCKLTDIIKKYNLKKSLHKHIKKQNIL